MAEKARVAERAAGDAVERLRDAERKVVDEREAAERRTRDSRAVHERLKLPVAARKRHKQGGEASSATAGATKDEGAEARQSEPDLAEPESDPAGWESYGLTDFKRLRSHPPSGHLAYSHLLCPNAYQPQHSSLLLQL
jgi:hypothetical protein